MLRGLFSIEELFCQIFKLPDGEEEIIKKIKEIYFNIGFKYGYNARKEEEISQIYNR